MNADVKLITPCRSVPTVTPIPGLNQGGWYDAGDFDIRTQTQYRVITDLVIAIEKFGVTWDDTTIDQKARSVEMRRPGGISDAVQQVEHGVLQILGQFHAVGHAINGIVEPTLLQYTHLGDGASKTDNRVYSAKLGKLESDGNNSGAPDDRRAFTTRTPRYSTAPPRRWPLQAACCTATTKRSPKSVSKQR